jgi:hypothetical protein
MVQLCVAYFHNFLAYLPTKLKTKWKINTVWNICFVQEHIPRRIGRILSCCRTSVFFNFWIAGRRAVPCCCTAGRKWGIAGTVTAGKRGKTARRRARITWNWKYKGRRWVLEISIRKQKHIYLYDFKRKFNNVVTSKKITPRKTLIISDKMSFLRIGGSDVLTNKIGARSQMKSPNFYMLRLEALKSVRFVIN